MLTINVILPLAIADTYTYSIPDGTACPEAGMRVLVPLGRKTITGLVYTINEEVPCSPSNTDNTVAQTIHLRDIIEVLDEQPIVLPSQLALWRWIADYYLCTLGEVMAAALPARLLDNDYTARTEVYISLHPRFTDIEQLQPVFDSLKRAPKQQRLLEYFLELSDAFDSTPHLVEQRQLIEQSGESTAVLRTLVEKNILCATHEVVSRIPSYDTDIEPAHPLTEQQQRAVRELQAGFENGKVCLLHGVTSSGKTEVYIHLIRQMLEQGRQVLYLVPEIALTTQLTDRLKKVFGKQLGVYHSRFSDMERVEIYKDLFTSKEPKVILSARSGVFLPFTDLGLIIVDEEHDSSFKQQDPAPRYHARSVAVVMAKAAKANVLLGTATPSIETYYNAQADKYRLVEMNERYAGLGLPSITLIDLKRQYHRKEMYEHFSDPLVERIREQLVHGKQIIIFQNRRGYAPYISCRKCGYVPKCCNCDVSLTYHKRTNSLVCHYCGYTMSAPASCPNCSGDWRDYGVGTEMIEDEVNGLFPEARVARMDLDTTRNKNSHQRIINAFARHEVDILIGTQMVTKGLHFNDVSLVAVLNADSMMQSPDFRSYERTFQMLEQVAGRAGRTGAQGEVIIQSFQPDNPLYAFLQKHDYTAFYAVQLKERKVFRFPPYYRLIVLTLKHRDYSRLDTAARELSQRLQAVFGNRCSGVIVPSVSRIQNMHLRTIRLRIESNASFAQAKALIMQHIRYVQTLPNCKGTVIQPDVDPIN